MNILILGSGGREHALAWAVMQNPKCDKLIVAPGNGGIAQIATCASLDIEDPTAVATFADDNSIDFVIVGPEAPLAAGIAALTPSTITKSGAWGAINVNRQARSGSSCPGVSCMSAKRWRDAISMGAAPALRNL